MSDECMSKDDYDRKHPKGVSDFELGKIQGVISTIKMLNDLIHVDNHPEYNQGLLDLEEKLLAKKEMPTVADAKKAVLDKSMDEMNKKAKRDYFND